MINNEWYLVDLPGYGYAKRSKTERSKWGKMIKSYILGRENLLTVFVLIDSRHEAQKNDLEFIEWLGVSGIPLALIFTKADKMKRNELEKSVSTFKKTLLDKWEELPPCFVTSAVKGRSGNDEVLEFIEKTNLVFDK